MNKIIVGVCLLLVLSQCQEIPAQLQELARKDPLLFQLPQEIQTAGNLKVENGFFCNQMHWIFALDESGSMFGTKWTKLQSLLTWLKWWLSFWNDFCFQYITAYTFDSRATLPPTQYYEYVSPVDFHPSTININGGGTNFGQALVRGLEFILLHRNINTCWVLITDGHAAFPDIEIDLFMMVKDYMNNKQGKDVCALCYHIKASDEAPPKNFSEMCKLLEAPSFSFKEENFEVEIAESLKVQSTVRLAPSLTNVRLP